jgi:hypothetical protein
MGVKLPRALEACPLRTRTCGGLSSFAVTGGLADPLNGKTHQTGPEAKPPGLVWAQRFGTPFHGSP